MRICVCVHGQYKTNCICSRQICHASSHMKQTPVEFPVDCKMADCFAPVYLGWRYGR